MAEFKVGDRIKRIKGQYIGEVGTIVAIPEHEPSDQPYTIHIKFDDPKVHHGRIYRGYSAFAELYYGLPPEESETIDV